MIEIPLHESDLGCSRTGTDLNLSCQYSENASLLSFDSIHTNGRLLDKLELTEEEELLLQKALEENTGQKNCLYPLDQEPAVCVPATGFPSLRNAQTDYLRNHRRTVSAGPTTMFSDDGILLSSRGSVVENNVSDLRYSYVAIVEDDEDKDKEGIPNRGPSSERNRFEGNEVPKYNFPLNIEKFRFKKYEAVELDATPPITSLFSSFEKDGTCTPIHTPGHTPKNSISSIRLNKSNTESSSDSDSGLKHSSRTPENKNISTFHYPNSNVFSTPVSDPKKCEKTKKSSFSLKNLFKSPKVRSTVDEPTTPSIKGKPTSLPNTPTMNFKFPRDESERTSSKIMDGSKQRAKMFPVVSRHLKTMSDCSTLPVIQNSNNSKPHTMVPKQQNVYRLLIDPRPSVKVSSQCKHTSNNTSPSDMSKNTKKIQLQRSASARRLLAKQHIALALEQRNKGNLRDSTVHLKEACKLDDKTAFLLYGLALRYGTGSRVDLNESFNWVRGATGIKNFNLQVFNRNVDPTVLHSPFDSPNNCTAPALYECGIAYIKGLGIDPDEWKGLKCLEYAASLGHVDSMCLCGTLWSRNQPTRRRDMRKAAAWFRLAKENGADLIGADWIYKEKYM